MQPQWAMPSEMLGMSNIYHNFMSWFRPEFASKLGHRSAGSLVFNVIASLLIVIAFVRHILTSRSLDKSFWLAAPAFVLAIFLWSYFHMKGEKNYLYMKSYTLFLPFLFTAFYAIPLSSPRRFQHLHKGVRYALSVAIIIVGLSYVHEYSATGTYVTNDMFELYAYSQETDLSNVVFLPKDKVAGESDVDHRRQAWQQRMLETEILPLFPVNMVDQSMPPEQNFNKHLQKRVYLILRKSDLPCWPCTAQRNAQRLVWQNHTFVIIDTGRVLRDAFPNGTSEPHLNVFWETI
jgi:hypothetical protein